VQRINLSKNKPDYCRLWLLVLDVREDIWVTFEIDCSRFYYSAFPNNKIPRNKLTGEYCSEITASGGIKINCMIPHSLTLICWTFDTGSYPSDHKMVISFAVQSGSCLNHVSGSEYQQWQSTMLVEQESRLGTTGCATLRLETRTLNLTYWKRRTRRSIGWFASTKWRTWQTAETDISRRCCQVSMIYVIAACWSCCSYAMILMSVVSNVRRCPVNSPLYHYCTVCNHCVCQWNQWIWTLLYSFVIVGMPKNYGIIYIWLLKLLAVRKKYDIADSWLW